MEVRFRDLQIGASVYLGDRALPTLTNSYRNIIEEQLIRFKLMRSNKKPFPILHGISGVLKPVSHGHCDWPTRLFPCCDLAHATLLLL